MTIFYFTSDNDGVRYWVKLANSAVNCYKAGYTGPTPGLRCRIGVKVYDGGVCISGADPVTFFDESVQTDGVAVEVDTDWAAPATSGDLRSKRYRNPTLNYSAFEGYYVGLAEENELGLQHIETPTLLDLAREIAGMIS